MVSAAYIDAFTELKHIQITTLSSLTTVSKPKRVQLFISKKHSAYI